MMASTYCSRSTAAGPRLSKPRKSFVLGLDDGLSVLHTRFSHDVRIFILHEVFVGPGDG